MSAFVHAVRIAQILEGPALAVPALKPFTYPARSQAKLDRQRQWGFGLLSLLPTLIFGVLFLTTSSFWMWMLILPAFAVLAFITCLLSFRPISPDRCEHVLRLCQAHPELNRFREAVLEQARPFVDVDVFMMEQWLMEEACRQAKQHNANIQKSACQALYGLKNADHP